jgi:hypothetical protein
MNHNIGVCCNNLLLWGQLGTLLEFEVSNSTGEGEVAIHPTEIDETAGGSDSCLLAWSHIRVSHCAAVSEL